MIERMSPEADVSAVRAVEAAYDAAWNAGDVESLLDCFADDAVLVNPRGELANGHDEIRQHIGSFLEGEARGSRHFSNVMRISFVTADVAVVDGEARLERALGAGSLAHRFTDVLARREGQWVIVHVRAYGLGEVVRRKDEAAQLGTVPDHSVRLVAGGARVLRPTEG